jgi:septal ring factor EnvC (AmiA/AmiB activator)
MYSLRFSFPFSFTAVVLTLLFLLIPQSQTSGQLSSNSGQHLQTWETLSTQFDQTLQAHEETLRELSERLKTSESNGERLTNLLDESLTQNADLKTYNTQIAQRMQERDEDLAAAYAELQRIKEHHRIVVIVCIIALLAVGALIYFHIMRP